MRIRDAYPRCVPAYPRCIITTTPYAFPRHIPCDSVHISEMHTRDSVCIPPRHIPMTPYATHSLSRHPALATLHLNTGKRAVFDLCLNEVASAASKASIQRLALTRKMGARLKMLRLNTLPGAYDMVYPSQLPRCRFWTAKQLQVCCQIHSSKGLSVGSA